MPTSSRPLIVQIIKDEINGRHSSPRGCTVNLSQSYLRATHCLRWAGTASEYGLQYPPHSPFGQCSSCLQPWRAFALWLLSRRLPLGVCYSCLPGNFDFFQNNFFSPKDWGCLEWGRKRAEHLGCFHEGNSLSHFLSHPRYPAPSLMARVETSPVTATITTRRMCVLWRRWVWPAIGSSSPLVWIQSVSSKIQNIAHLASGKPLGRFSIGWTRILPEGTGARNPDGIQYYHNLIGDFDLDFDTILHFFSRVAGKRYCPGSDSLPLGFATSPAGHCLIKLLNALLLGSMYFWSWLAEN